jgi:hypothetical protein
VKAKAKHHREISGPVAAVLDGRVFLAPLRQQLPVNIFLAVGDGDHIPVDHLQVAIELVILDQHPLALVALTDLGEGHKRFLAVSCFDRQEQAHGVCRDPLYPASWTN